MSSFRSRGRNQWHSDGRSVGFGAPLERQVTPLERTAVILSLAIAAWGVLFVLFLIARALLSVDL